MKRKKIELEGARLANFILRHESFCHPEIVLGDSVTLMAIDDESVIFAVCEDTQVHSHQVGPFFYINQFRHCTKIIRIPIRHFITLMQSERVREDVRDLQLVLLSNTGRCGSTLLTQLFEDLVPGTVSISEPEILMPFVSRDVFRGRERSKLLRACVDVLCASAKREKQRDEVRVRYVVIKPKAHAIALTTELTEIYPGIMHLYLFRHPVQYYIQGGPKITQHVLSETQKTIQTATVTINLDGFTDDPFNMN